MSTPCQHYDQIDPANRHHENTHGCEECLKSGDRWVHLRVCLVCGHVGCCDQSPNRHATKHFHATSHAMMRSGEPGETWGWCYVDRKMFDPV